jgi:PAS domain S-box-containing protein
VNPAAAQKSHWRKGLSQAGRTVWAIALALVLLLMAAFVIVQQTVSNERAQAFASAQDINSKMVLSDEMRIRSLLVSFDKVLLVLRKDFAENPRLSRQALLLRLDELKVDDELSPRISFVGAAGEVVLSTARSGDDQKFQINVADRAYFQMQKTAQGDLLDVGAPIKSRITGKWVVPLTRRITRKDGAFGGLMSMTVDPALFTDPFEQTSLGANATRAIIGLDGYTRMRLNGGKLVFGGDIRTSQLFNQIKQSKAGCYTATAASDGVRRLVCYRVIDPYGIAIVAGSAVDSIEGSYSNKVRGTIIAASVFAVLIVLLSGVLVLGIVRQRELLASQQRFNQLIELVPQSIFRMNAQGNIMWVNRRTLDYAGPSAQEQAKGFDWVVAAVHQEDQGRLKDFVSSALQLRPNAESCEYRKRRFDGVYLWYSSQVTRVLDQDGAGDFFLVTSTDIHDRRMVEERTRVTQKLESIGQLTGGMAHDFNNLLAIMVGNHDLLRSEALSEVGAKRLEVASSAAQRGVGLVKSLLALASKQPLLPATVDLWALVERVSPLLRHALGQRVNFEMKPPVARVHVKVDEAGLEAVLLNLIVNARDAMPRGGDLRLGLEVAHGMARLVIRDTGVGMPEAVRKRATEPFFTTKERDHGTGLGLSMVAGFVKQSGGTLQIHSTEGQGTAIEIALPLALATAAPLLPGAAVAPRAAASSPRSILIVDDEPALAELVRDWARAEGHIAVLTQSADDALTLLAVKSFDVLLTDIMMPGQMDGIGLAEKASQMYPAMQILLMSGYSRETATNRADIPWPLLVKPFRKEDLDAVLQQG